MTQIYQVKADRPLHPRNPLHVGNFYHKARLHRGQMEDRQALILYLAALHRSASRGIGPRGFHQVQVPLTKIRDWVYDFHQALDPFFEVQQHGYSVQGISELSTLIPRALPPGVSQAIQSVPLRYSPGPRPDDNDAVVSKVYVKPLPPEQREKVESRLAEEGRHHLLHPVRWIWEHQELNFLFKPAGKLKLRDTAIWPVPAIETWPSWLRETLFGEGLDIESAYTQYLLQQLQTFMDAARIELLYPDLVELMRNKQAWRRALAEEVLGLQWSDDAASLVKRITMSLANGSKVSPAILQSGSGFSVTADIIISATKDVSSETLERIGTRLRYVASQYVSAKKQVCINVMGLNATTRNQKKIFSNYFEWERTARYLMWEAVGCHGIMVHDGIDGIPEEYLLDLPKIIDQVGVKITR